MILITKNNTSCTMHMLSLISQLISQRKGGILLNIIKTNGKITVQLGVYFI